MKKFLLSLVVLLLLPGSALALPPGSSLQVLVNKSHSLQPRSYEPAALTVPAIWLARPASDPEMQLRPAASGALSKMFKSAAQSGIVLVLSSGYRSYADQRTLYQQELSQYGSQATEQVAPPGFSEHQTGLAADIILNNYLCAAQGCFTITRAADWLQHNAYRFGFTLRYPLHKERATGYEYEPWHYRYVGTPLAGRLFRNHQTLEEYYQSDN